jgi:hypothetical protein
LRVALAADAKNPAVHAEPAFIKGLIEIQDEGSQLAALLAGAKPGEQVVDLCAGAGGKTLALAAAMENRGQIYATDLDKRRLAPIHARLERADARNVQVRTPSGQGDGMADPPTAPTLFSSMRLHRHRRLAITRRQVARAQGRCGADQGQAAASTAQWRWSRPAAALLCHLLGAGRGERRSGAKLPRAHGGCAGAAGRSRRRARRAGSVSPRRVDVGEGY